jgi:enoyl-CoA hydratase/carnithine racemase
LTRGVAVAPAHLEDLLIDPRTFRAGSDWAELCVPSGRTGWPPLGLVDLQACPAELRMESLPSFPLIGFGDASHPLAPMLDTVIESPVSVDGLARHVARAPHAAAVAAQLLRGIEGLPTDRALQFESFCYALLQGSGEHARWLAARAHAARDSGVRDHARDVSGGPRPPSAAGRVVVDRCGAELHIVLDRPLSRNAIDRAMRDQLVEALSVAAADPEVRSIKLRALGAAFSVGGDLEEFGTTRDPATAHLIRSRSSPALAIGTRADILDAHVHGACIGAGLEIAAFAARLSASSEAWFQLPELSMGLIPGAGGCVSLPRRIGRQRTLLMILSGRRINARTALRWGLIDEIEPQSAWGGSSRGGPREQCNDASQVPVSKDGDQAAIDQGMRREGRGDDES